MISITAAELTQWLSAFIYPLARVLGLFAAAPVLGNTAIPRRVKIALGLLLSMLLAGTIPSPQVPLGSGLGLLLLGRECVIGVAIGFALRLVFAAVEYAGELIGAQMGLGFAILFDPAEGEHTQVLARFLGLVTTLAFLAVDGHLVTLALVVESFQRLPAGQTLSAGGFGSLAEIGATVFGTALGLALPLIAALLIANLFVAVLARAAPQLNLFAVGFPLTLGLGLLALVFWLPSLLSLDFAGLATTLARQVTTAFGR